MNVIEIFDRRVSNSTFDVLHPLVALVLVPAVEHADLIDWKNYLERVEDGGGALQ